MKTSGRLLVVSMSCLLVVGFAAEQAAPKAPAAATTPKPAGSPAGASTGSKSVATVQDLMSIMIDPASKVVFNAVSTTELNGADVKKVPKDDAEWATVRNNALMMVEGANLIMMSGRHIAKNLAAKGNEGELPPAEIEKRVGKDRPSWDRLAREFQAAAMVSFKAAEAKDADAIFASGEGIDSACENCHLKFWYPDQEKLFDKPAKK